MKQRNSSFNFFKWGFVRGMNQKNADDVLVSDDPIHRMRVILRGPLYRSYRGPSRPRPDANLDMGTADNCLRYLFS